MVADTQTELELDEEGTRISLTIVDTPGFGDQIDNEARFVMPCSRYIWAIARLTETLQLRRNRGIP